MGLEVAAVDLIEADVGPMVFDVNSSPGLKGLEAATGQDLALLIIGRAQEIARTGRPIAHQPDLAVPSSSTRQNSPTLPELFQEA